MSNDLTDVCNIGVDLDYSVSDYSGDTMTLKMSNNKKCNQFVVTIGGSVSDNTVEFNRDDVHKLAEFFTKSLEAIGIAHSEKKK